MPEKRKNTNKVDLRALIFNSEFLVSESTSLTEPNEKDCKQRIVTFLNSSNTNCKAKNLVILCDPDRSWNK